VRRLAEQMNWLRATLAILLFVAGSFASAQTGTKGSVALVGGTIYVDPSAPPIGNGTVYIRDGVIVAVGRREAVPIPKGVATIDCSGMTVTAGFWNSHVHFHERKWFDADKVSATDLGAQLNDMLTRRGFTSVFDTWSNFANTRKLRARIESGEVVGPRIRTVGEAIMLKGGVLPEMVGAAFGPVQIAEVASAAEAGAAANKLIENGADGVKVYAMTYPQFALSEETMAAAAAEAHRHGKPVFAHPTLAKGLLSAVRGGANVIAHTTPLSGPWNDAALNAMKDKGVAVIPTLKLWRYVGMQRLVDPAAAQIKAWIDVGGDVLFGTDVGYMQDYDTAEEFEYMAKAGMDYRQILASLTTAPSQRFGEAQKLGKLASGLLGDVVVMRGNPAESIEAFSAIAYTIREGKVIFDANGISGHPLN
jgi:imidazolonepropionase-like amidohydrolase